MCHRIFFFSLLLLLILLLLYPCLSSPSNNRLLAHNTGQPERCSRRVPSGHGDPGRRETGPTFWHVCRAAMWSNTNYFLKKEQTECHRIFFFSLLLLLPITVIIFIITKQQQAPVHNTGQPERCSRRVPSGHGDPGRRETGPASWPCVARRCGAIQIIFKKRANRVPPHFLLLASSSPSYYCYNFYQHRATTGCGSQHWEAREMLAARALGSRGPRPTWDGPCVLAVCRVQLYKNKIKMN